jgi:hypothetical protein
VKIYKQSTAWGLPNIKFGTPEPSEAENSFCKFEIIAEDGNYMPSPWGYWKRNVEIGGSPVTVLGYFVLCIEYKDAEENAVNFEGSSFSLTDVCGFDKSTPRN